MHNAILRFQYNFAKTLNMVLFEFQTKLKFNSQIPNCLSVQRRNLSGENRHRQQRHHCLPDYLSGGNHWQHCHRFVLACFLESLTFQLSITTSCFMKSRLPSLCHLSSLTTSFFSYLKNGDLLVPPENNQVPKDEKWFFNFYYNF